MHILNKTLPSAGSSVLLILLPLCQIGTVLLVSLMRLLEGRVIASDVQPTKARHDIRQQQQQQQWK